MNTMKTFILMAALTALLIAIGAILGGKGGMIIALVIAVAMNFGSYWFSDKIVLKMYHAQQLTRESTPQLFRITEDLAMRAGLPMPQLYLIPNPQPNAFATGRDPNHAVVAVTEGLLRLLPENELRGVIAHELAHVRNRDILVGTIAATLAGAVSMIANMATWALMFGGRGSDDRDGSPLAGILMLILAPIAATLIQLAVSRSREFLADETAAQFTGDPSGLANALRRLHTSVQRLPMEANPATAHMFIVSPLSGGGFTKLFSTHPPMEERIARLEQLMFGRAS